MSRDIVFVEVLRRRSKKSEQFADAVRFTADTSSLLIELVAQARKFFLRQQEFLTRFARAAP
jgi:hypothetical protein